MGILLRIPMFWYVNVSPFFVDVAIVHFISSAANCLRFISVNNSQPRKIGSVADIDPMNGVYGSMDYNSYAHQSHSQPHQHQQQQHQLHYAQQQQQQQHQQQQQQQQPQSAMQQKPIQKSISSQVVCIDQYCK